MQIRSAGRGLSVMWRSSGGRHLDHRTAQAAALQQAQAARGRRGVGHGAQRAFVAPDWAVHLAACGNAAIHAHHIPACMKPPASSSPGHAGPPRLGRFTSASPLGYRSGPAAARRTSSSKSRPVDQNARAAPVIATQWIPGGWCGAAVAQQGHHGVKRSALVRQLADGVKRVPPFEHGAQRLAGEGLTRRCRALKRRSGHTYLKPMASSSI